NFILTNYFETEREFWALFPETQGKRVNFCQIGLTAQLYTEVSDSGEELKSNEVYFLMPCEDRHMRPVRMQAVRHLSVSEYRVSRMWHSVRQTSVAAAASCMGAVSSGPSVTRSARTFSFSNSSR